ncbi:MAG: bifunctional folylpolyglutamate synthase/dihydrofolate synthase [Duodenibacillus sp.]|nr:bifunctional folylpolyglutamate synthase/dihydrofolate synthase [Duodenibacillus sp.]
MNAINESIPPAAPGDGAGLAEWLGYIERLHSKPVDLGLERMRAMIGRLGIRFACPVFTVAGTNGKGSTCAMIDAVLRSAGLRTGMHTSPHLIDFNERAVICGEQASDAAIVAAFKEVEAARAGMPLTYFEYTGLAVLLLFARARLDAVVLEIGLGGRLDAMNAVDADCGVVCALGVDHVAYLGSSREGIAYEKACIYRRGKPAVCTDRDPPATLPATAAAIGAPLMIYGRDFETERLDESEGGGFVFRGRDAAGREVAMRLPLPAMQGANQLQNAAGAVAAVLSVPGLPVTPEAVGRGLRAARLPGRFEPVDPALTGGVPLVIDVGHNPNAAEALRANLAEYKKGGEPLWAVFGMLADKDMRQVAAIVGGLVDAWFVASLTGPRAATAGQLAACMLEAGVDAKKIKCYENVGDALRAALREALEPSRRPVKMVAFGSFVTVAAVRQALAAGAAP